MKLNENLTFIKELGSGTYGTVSLCMYEKHGVSKKVAVKSFRTDLIDTELQIKEAKICASLIHPNIVQLYSVEKDNSGNILLIYEYVEGLSLREFLDKNRCLSDHDAKRISLNILKGIQYAHQNNIIHHDISPRNIIISKHEEVKILDFGLSKIVGVDVSEDGQLSGSLSYYDPYLLQNNSNYDKCADIYSLNLIFFEMITGRKLFSAPTSGSLISEIMNFKGLEEVDFEGISCNELKSYFARNLSVERKERDTNLNLINFFANNKKKSIPWFDYISYRLIGQVLITSMIALAIGFFISIWSKEDKALFYVKEGTEYYAAKKKIDKDVVIYSNYSPSFTSKTCDFYFYSFSASMFLLKSKFSVGTLNLLENHYNLLKFMGEVCPNSQYQKILSFLINAQDDFSNIKDAASAHEILDRSSLVKVTNVFLTNDAMLLTFNEGMSWIKNYFSSIDTLVGTDIFRLSSETMNLENCNYYSQLTYVHKNILHPNKRLNKITDYSVLGINADNLFQIVGTFKKGILFEVESLKNVKKTKFCHYEIVDDRPVTYFGELDFVSLKE